MSSGVLLAAGVMALGTYLIRLLGVTARRRPSDDEQGLNGQLLADRSVVMLLAGVVVVTAAYDGQDFAGPARLAGVAAGGIAALLRLPLVGVVVIAAGVTAVLRLLGVP